MVGKLGSFVVVFGIAACGGGAKQATTPPPAVDAARASLAFDVEPSDADVEIDGAARGKASDLGAIELAPGPHQIVISKAGFEVWRGEVALETKPETIQVRLVPTK